MEGICVIAFEVYIMPFITCVEQEVEAMNARIKVTIQATPQDVCEEAKRAKGDINTFVSLLRNAWRL